MRSANDGNIVDVTWICFLISQIYVKRLHASGSNLTATQINPFVEGGHYFGDPPLLILTNHDLGASYGSPIVQLARIDLLQLGKDLAKEARAGDLLDQESIDVSFQDHRPSPPEGIAASSPAESMLTVSDYSSDISDISVSPVSALA